MRGALPPHYFNSHPREGGDLFCADGFDSHADFNSRPREGGDAKLVNCTAHLSPISIHAPARGATRPLGHSRSPPRFQFSPPRGGRPNEGVHPAFRKDFNSRPREGGDRLRSGQGPGIPQFQFSPPRGGRRACVPTPRVHPMISILAPARGATYPGWMARNGRYFNSRPREGGDVEASMKARSPAGFQFSPPRGGRPGP